MGRRERPIDHGRKTSCGIFQHKSLSRERGQFWQGITTNRNNYQDFSVMLCIFRDGFMTIMRNKMIKLGKKYKELNLVVKSKQSIKLHAHF